MKLMIPEGGIAVLPNLIMCPLSAALTVPFDFVTIFERFEIKKNQN